MQQVWPRHEAGWDGQGGAARATVLEKAADLFERDRALLIGLCIREAGKTLADSKAAEVAQAYGLAGYPFFVWVDASGKVTMRASGELTREAVDAGNATLTAGAAQP